MTPIRKAVHGTAGRRVPPVKPKAVEVNDTNSDVAEVKLLPGERSYLKTIAALRFDNQRATGQ